MNATTCLAQSSPVPLIFLSKSTVRLWPGVTAASATVAFWSGFMQSAEISTSGFFVTCTDGRTEESQILVLPGLAAGSGGIIITPIFDALLLLWSICAFWKAPQTVDKAANDSSIGGAHKHPPAHSHDDPNVPHIGCTSHHHHHH